MDVSVVPGSRGVGGERVVATTVPSPGSENNGPCREKHCIGAPAGVTDLSMPTPLRRKRHQSPAPPVGPPGPVQQPRAPVVEVDLVETPQLQQHRASRLPCKNRASPQQGGKKARRPGFLIAAVVLGLGVVVASVLNVRTAGRRRARAAPTPHEPTTGPAPVEVVVEEEAVEQPLLNVESVAGALSSAAARSAVLNVLWGALVEFGTDLGGADVLQRLPSLMVGGGGSETSFQELLLQLSDTVPSWPPALQSQLEGALALGSAQAKAVPRAEPLMLKVNLTGTSQGAAVETPSWMQALLDLGAATGLERFTSRVSRLKSKPADVVVSQAPITRGDCFAFSADASLTLELVGDEGPPRGVRRVAIQQPSRWEVQNPRTAPRHFAVYGLPAVREGAPPAAPILLGAFEYSLAAPARQEFELAETRQPLRALRLDFAALGWGEPYTCVYRISAHES